MPVGEKIIRENESQEELWNSQLNNEEKQSIQKIMEEAKTINARDKLNKANELNPIIMRKFTIYDRNFNKETGKFEETQQAQVEDKSEVQKNVEQFYGNLLTDLRSQYESLSYEKWQGDQAEEILQLASFFIDLMSWPSDAGLVRQDKTLQQTEEKFKFAMRNLPEIQGGKSEKIDSDVMVDIPWYVLSETRYEIKNGPQKTTEWLYRLPMADLWEEAMNKNFAELIKQLDREGVKITGYEITGLASTVNYSDNKTIQIWGQDFLVKDNTTLADGRSKLTEERLKNKFWNKMGKECQSKISYQTDVGKEKIDYNDPAHPEYKAWTTDPKWRSKLDELFGPYQWVNIKVDYIIEEKIPKYVYTKENAPEAIELYNTAPTMEFLIKDTNKPYLHYQVSWEKLDQGNPMINWNPPANKEIWDNKEKDMFGKNGVVEKMFDKYMLLSQEDPTNYPPISDKIKNTSWVDKMQWTNNMIPGKGEVVQQTPIMNLDLSNPDHKSIYEEMESTGFIDKNGTISNDKTDKFISEYTEKWMKQYIKAKIATTN